VADAEQFTQYLQSQPKFIGYTASYNKEISWIGKRNTYPGQILLQLGTQAI
jgi:hypothetical protein